VANTLWSSAGPVEVYYDKVMFILRSKFSNEITLLIPNPFLLRKGNLSLQKQENIPIWLPLWGILYSKEGLFFSLPVSPIGLFHIIYFSIHDSLITGASLTHDFGWDNFGLGSARGYLGHLSKTFIRLELPYMKQHQQLQPLWLKQVAKMGFCG
jgi:hypothetical protein